MTQFQKDKAENDIKTNQNTMNYFAIQDIFNLPQFAKSSTQKWNIKWVHILPWLFSKRIFLAIICAQRFKINSDGEFCYLRKMLLDELDCQAPYVILVENIANKFSPNVL